ncbi:hypothetical protein GmHk_18G052974 [Glycine max]|nr:hypothetical protein GmHk_18G052974 [Glycine max]
MILVDYLETTGVRRGKPAFLKNLFGSLKKLEFDGAIKREIVIPSHVLPYLKTLEEFNVHSSDAAQVIFDIDDTDTNTKGMVLPLKKLILKDLSNLKCVWNKTPRGILSFPNLQLVFVTKCRSLATLFPLSLAKNLVNLQTLTVWRCDKLVEIVGKEDAMELGRTEIFEFPCLSKLYLFKLSLLSCFYPGKHHLQCPLLESLDVSYCPKLKLFTSEFHNSHKEAVIEQPLFMVEKVDPKLKELTLNEENIILLRDAHLPQDFLCKLNILDLSFDDYENKKDTLPFDFLHKVPSVECLRVQRCYGLKEIFPSQKLQVHHGILARLNELYLFKLKELESIGLEHPWVKPYSAKLETLEIRKCSRLEKVVSCAVSFSSLKELQVSECERMEYLFTSSTAKSLVQLKILYIEKCESIKEIVRKEDESDASEEMIFGRLTKLRLESLGRLVRFYSGDGTLQFSCLEEATIAECPNMNTFSEGFVNAPMFEGIKTSTEDSDLTFHHDLNSTIKMLFHQQVEKSACDIEHLKFGDHHHLEEIWLGVVPIPSNNCFKSLKSLTVVECESLSNVIPFYLLRFLCNLKEIEVSNCHSVKAIFDMKGTEADMKPTSQISLPLKKLILNQLPNLEHIWNLNPDEILSFQEFQEVCISKCQSLKSLFPTSVASHLAMLDVRSCATLEEIFVENEAVLKGETKQFNFHCLTTLTLWELPELKYFYNEKHSLEWPMLTQLDVYHCDKLKLFTTENHSGEVADIEYPLRASIDQQAVFSVEKVMPSLEHQATTCEDNMIGQGQFVANAAHLLQNLKVLKLMCYHEDDESNIFSSGLLEEISSIENLEVFCSSFNEIISSQIPSTNYTKVLSKLKKLHLKSLQQLNSIGLEHSWVEPLLKTLETLEVFSCPNMKNLVPSTVPFSNLTSLNVEECHGLVYLFTSSTAKSLGQLKHMSIRDCQAIQEIVSREGDQESNDEEITFEQLRVLSLESLPSIVGIYSGKYKLKFPSLDQVTLMECPQMKYSYMLMHHGTESSTLGFVGKDYSDGSCCYSSLSSHPSGIVVAHIFYLLVFVLIISINEIPNLKHLFPLSVATDLENWKSLMAMKEIVAWDNGSNENAITFKFPQLNTVSLQNSFELVSFYRGTHALEWPSLKKLSILNCFKLEGLTKDITNSQGKPIVLATEKTLSLNDVRICHLFLIKKITHYKYLVEWFQVIYNLESMEMSLKEAEWLKKYSVSVHRMHKLQRLVLYGLKNTEILFWFLHDRLPNLKSLTLGSCQLKSIWAPASLISRDKIGVVMQLKELELKSLLSLEETGFEHDPLLQRIERLVISRCMKLTNLVSSKLFVIKSEKINLIEFLVADTKNKNTQILFWFHHDRLPNLKSLTLGSCQLKSIWAPASLISRDKIGVVMQLKELELKSLLSLEETGFEHDPLLQRIERLVISRCMKLTNLVSSKVFYSYMTHLEVMNCRSMRNLMTSSTAKSLVQLTTMKVSLCEIIVEIVAENKEEKNWCLYKISHVLAVTSNCDFKFPSLESLVVTECPQMKKFSKLEKKTNGIGKVSFEYSKHTRLVDYPETKGFRHDKPVFRENFFGCLKKLEFDGESKREIVIPSHVLPYLKTLEELYVHNSDAVQIIFDTVDTEAKTKGIVFRLKKLILKDLSNLKCVWNKNPRGTLSFPNLSLVRLFPLSLAQNLGKLKTLEIQFCDKLVEIVGKEDALEHGTTEIFEFPYLRNLFLYQLSLLSCFYPGKHHLKCPLLKSLLVSYCPKLKLLTSEFRDSPKQAVTKAPISQLQQQPLSLATLFPLSLAKILGKLQTLTVLRCDKLVEIVGKEDAMEHGTTEIFEFRYLLELVLYKLSLLSCFYPGKHHLECPVLECLDVSYCPMLKLFTSEFHNSHKEAVIEQPLFMVEKVDPKLKELTLNEENIILLRDAHLPQDFLCKLNILDLSFDDYENKKDTLPFDFLHKVPSVECLRVQRCYGLKEIFPSQKLQVHHGILARLNDLFLNKLKELESIGLEHPWVKPYSAKLEILEIRKCSRLEKVVSCAVSFISLKELYLSDCERMEYLFTFSTAKSLVQLKMLYIEKCESIKEIVRKEDESDLSEEMIFGRLTKLRLESLGRLVRFYSGDGTLQFSCLEEATIAECPNMNTFSEGFVEKSACDIEHLKFGDHHHLEEIWLC